MFPTEFMDKAGEKVKEMKTKRHVEATAAATTTAVGQGENEKLPPVSEDVTMT